MCPCPAHAAQKLSKVKASDKLSIPLKLDMAGILAMAGAQPLQTGTHEDAQYELMSILIHKGPSASHGHYGALPHCPSLLKSTRQVPRMCQLHCWAPPLKLRIWSEAQLSLL